MTIETAALGAQRAFADWAHSSGQERAGLLEALAAALEAHRESIVGLADEETHLGATRLNGELDRTCFQLRSFASFSLSGAAFSFDEDAAVPGPPPAGHPRLVRVRVPLGPVAMFSASNFPLAFSVLGGDTASALAAGCPVVVKAHPAHRRLSAMVHGIAVATLERLGLPAGLIGHVDGDGPEVGIGLLRHRAIAAAAFTGSVGGGLALERVCQERTPPIPFFGELGSANPVVILPSLRQDAAGLAMQLAASAALGTGQFCTSPGIVLLERGRTGAAFIGQLAAALAAAPLHPMLTPGIADAFARGAAQRARTAGVLVVPPCDGKDGRPFLATTHDHTFLRTPALHEELFGPAILVVLCERAEDFPNVLQALPGSLTVTIWGAGAGSPLARSVTAAAMGMAGRVIFDGMPTGVAVSRAQHHSGPWPACTRPESTSVGLAAVDRFLRPVALQEPPAWLAAEPGRPLAP
jgi:NADP-dependent aldehyde dehydrogenase